MHFIAQWHCQLSFSTVGWHSDRQTRIQKTDVNLWIAPHHQSRQYLLCWQALHWSPDLHLAHLPPWILSLYNSASSGAMIESGGL